MKLTAKALKLYECMKENYINYGYMYGGCISYNEDIVNEMNVTTKEFNELIKNNLVQLRNCDSYAYELTKDERTKLILNNKLHKVWEEKAPYFYPNSKHGEVFHVLGYSIL